MEYEISFTVGLYDKTFDHKVVIGHCDQISLFSDFALYLNTQLIYTYFFQIMNAYDLIFDPKVLIGPCDLISRFSDFALYLGLNSLYMNRTYFFRVATHRGKSQLFQGQGILKTVREILPYFMVQ